MPSVPRHATRLACCALAALLLSACPARPQGTPTPNTGGSSGKTGQSAGPAGGEDGAVTKANQTKDADGRRLEDIEFLADGFAIRGRLVLPPDGDPVPGVLLVHMVGSDRTAWDAMQLLLADRGIGSLAIDLRGHGTSENGPRGFESFGELDWQGALSDVRNGFQALEELAEIDSARRGIVGASIGANYAILIGAEFGDTPVVALSASNAYHGIAVEPSVPTVSDNLLVAATTKDEHAARFLDWVVETHPEVEVWQGEGNAHGTNMLPEASLEEQILDFLNRRWEAIAPGSGEDDLGILTPEESTDDSGFPVDEVPSDEAPVEDPPSEDDWQDELPPASDGT